MVDEIELIFFSFSNGKKSFQFGGNGKNPPTFKRKELKVSAGADSVVLCCALESCRPLLSQEC